MKNRKLIVAIVIFLVMAGAFGIRFYKFHDWLYFKMDQSRDAFMIANAVQNGPEFLPLLGPRAGATQVSNGYLRLGPAFYYFQYLAGKIFNSTEPNVFAYPDLFFSIMIIPLLYLFARLYFSRSISLLIVLMYSFSFLVIQYSRFAWNPNSLSFFTILSFYGLLKFLNCDKSKSGRWWLALWALGLSIGSQLHFFGFFALLGISALLILAHYEVWKISRIKELFAKESLKGFFSAAAVTILIFLAVSSPIIISDVMKKGENSKNFIQALSSKPKNEPLRVKIRTNIEENLKYYCLITTSGCYRGEAKDNVILVLITGVILLAGIYASIREIRKNSSQISRDFAWLMLFWIGVFFILSIPVASQLRPRFFILVFAVPFLFLGMIFLMLEEKFGKIGRIAAVLLTAAILAMNAKGTQSWFREQGSSQVEHTAVKRTLILKVKDGVTLGQLGKAVDYIYRQRKNDSNIYYYVKPEHVRPIRYLFAEINDPGLKYNVLKLNEDPKAQYFAITPSDGGIKPFQRKYGDNFQVLSQKQFGQIMVYEVNFTNRNINDNFRFNRDRGRTDRIFWKDVFGIAEKNGEAINIEGGE